MFVKFQLCSSNSFGDMRGSLIYTMERCAPGMPLAKNFTPQNEYLTLPNCMYNFNFPTLIV